MKKLYVFISLFFCVITLNAYIIETDTLKAVLDYIPHSPDKNGILIIFDVDNTLVETEQELGSDQWFYYILQQYTAKGLSINDATAYLLPLYYLIREVAEIKVVEPNTVQLIEEIKQQGVRCIALTAQGFHLVKRTTNQLHALGINFADSSFFGNYVSKMYQCKGGVIFCNGNDKGDVLLDAFAHNNYYPYTIIFADDKKSNLTRVSDKTYPYKINFYGIRYSRLDEKIAHFDPAIADKQLERFYRQYNIAPPEIPDVVLRRSAAITQV